MTVRLIFRPRNPVHVGPWTLQGVIPRRRDDIAASLARTITSELLSADELWSTLDTAENRQELFSGVRRALRKRFERLPGFPFREALLARTEDLVVREVEDYLKRATLDPDLPQKLLARVPVESLIVNKIRSFDLADFERLILGLSRRELLQIEVLGGLLGFFVGLFLPLIQMLAHW